MTRFRSALLLLPLALLALLALRCRAFELQDTIHALIEENIHLHDQLENLTQALRQLKRMLWHHSNDQNHHDHPGEDIQHLWEEWSEHGVSAETHLLLEQALCGHEPHNSSGSLHDKTSILLLPPLYLTVLISGCLLST